ncbi:MAG: hypothetical protein UY04_C0033G0012 [Parcubacteria group bacterium GW2011_GWA2_47_7]|nr:MAG: hypothetical protein UY04_C0033G0012 [Parcubacteria group bacterium GW2011_GWA2_47_7]
MQVHPVRMLDRRTDMKSTYQELFQRLPRAEAPEALYQSVLTSVDKIRIRAMRIKFALFSFLGLGAGISLVPLTSSAVTQAIESGFVDYASLALSDSAVILSYWKEFSITLIESLPILGITMILLALFTLLESVRHATKNSRAVFTHHFA